MTKLERDNNKLARWESMMLSKFCVECMGIDADYRHELMPGVFQPNVYPSDVLKDWTCGWRDKDGKLVYSPMVDASIYDVCSIHVSGYRKEDASDLCGKDYYLPDNFWTDDCESDKW